VHCQCANLVTVTTGWSEKVQPPSFYQKVAKRRPVIENFLLVLCEIWHIAKFGSCYILQFHTVCQILHTKTSVMAQDLVTCILQVHQISHDAGTLRKVM